MDTLPEQQRLHQAILDELLECTPESWSSIRYEVTCAWNEGSPKQLSHEIISPEGHAEQILASRRLLEATQQLAVLCGREGARWKRMNALASSNEQDQWKLAVDFEY